MPHSCPTCDLPTRNTGNCDWCSIEYFDLYQTFPGILEGFSYEDYYKGEQIIIKPALEKLGYTNVRFGDGERDSFGPLSRVVIVTAPDGKLTHYVYG